MPSAGGPRSLRPSRINTSESLAYYTSADVVLLSQLQNDGLTDATMAALRAEFPYEGRSAKSSVLRREPRS